MRSRMRARVLLNGLRGLEAGDLQRKAFGNHDWSSIPLGLTFPLPQAQTGRHRRLGAWGPLGSPHQQPGPRCPCRTRFCLEKPLERALQGRTPCPFGVSCRSVRLFLVHSQRS